MQQFLACLLLFNLVSISVQSFPKCNKQPNIIFMVADDAVSLTLTFIF